MNAQIKISGKSVSIELSEAAINAMKLRTAPLLAEMELYFSCLVRKKVRFYDGESSDDKERIDVNDKLAVRFRPVMTQSCSVGDDAGEEPPVTDFPIAKPSAFIPHWLRIDYCSGEWCGEFGYT